MAKHRFGACGRAGRAWTVAIALLLISAVGLGVLPISVEQPLLPKDETACRFEPIDVCGAGDASLGMIADTPVLLAETAVVVVSQAALPAPSHKQVSLLEGFAPGVYHPPRLSC